MILKVTYHVLTYPRADQPPVETEGEHDQEWQAWEELNTCWKQGLKAALLRRTSTTRDEIIIGPFEGVELAQEDSKAA
jgi:hypothetical protein